MTRWPPRDFAKRHANERGQMSIFVALIFQVLFVMFAMVINIGLLVHDKINLQNAVDLGAYYAAERQAEIMNEIAHINYQIRQDYKLLTWRYRVLGTLGREGDGKGAEDQLPPAMRASSATLTDVPWDNPIYRTPLGADIPAVCVANEMWREYAKNSGKSPANLCRSEKAIPAIPPVVILAPFVPGVAAAAGITKKAIDLANLDCSNGGPINWALTMQMLYAFKLSVAARSLTLERLRRELTSENLVDQNMIATRKGVLATIKKNLTAGNLEGFDESDFELANGLNDPRCKGSDSNGLPTLQPIYTVPLLYYNQTHVPPGGGCELLTMRHDELGGLDINQVKEWDPGGIMQSLTSEPEAVGSLVPPTFSRLGYEKNPWCMAYVGIKAKTRARQPFAPFGQPITLEARSFAQPFGGRIGPWYRSRWPNSSDVSSGGDRVDPLTSPRFINGNLEDSGINAGDKRRIRLPNYSRTPGDKLGLTSLVALGAQRPIFNHYKLAAGSKALANMLSIAFYAAFDNLLQNGDPLAWDTLGGDTTPTPVVQPIRNAEIAAIAPDLFDATYYSIEPSYYQNYLRLNSLYNRFPGMDKIFNVSIRPLPDLGGRNGAGGLEGFSVSGQIAVSTSMSDPTLMGSGKIYWLIRDWMHLLTGWVSNKVQNFGFPDWAFGKCEKESNSFDVTTPGRCIQGGRVGYSVRLISREHLLSDQWAIGGAGESPGPIWNPPSKDF